MTLRRYIERLVTTYSSSNNKKSFNLSIKRLNLIGSKFNYDSDNSDISDYNEVSGPTRTPVSTASSSQRKLEKAIIAGNDYNAVADIILKRSCRTNAGIDSYFLVQEIFCVDGTFITHRTGNDPPTRVDVFITHSGNNGEDEGGDCLCSRIEVRNSYAIYDSDMMDFLTGQKDQDPPPWLDVETTVIDESNHKLNSHSRRLKISVTSPNTTGTVSFGNRERNNSTTISTPIGTSTIMSSDKVFSKLESITARNSTDNSDNTLNNNRGSLFNWIKLR